MNNNEWLSVPPGPCPTADGIPCGFNASNCYLPEQACNGVNDCSNPLAFDEIPDLTSCSFEAFILFVEMGKFELPGFILKKKPGGF